MLRILKDGVRTAGVITREGVSRGLTPYVETLSLGAMNPTRHNSDILPYLPSYRPFFDKLPTEVAAMELKIIKVPLQDIECVTDTVVKVRGPMWHLKIKKGTKSSDRNHTLRLLSGDVEVVKFTETEMLKFMASWLEPQWNELDWSRIKEITTRDLLERRADAARRAQQGACFDCSDFVKHVSKQRC